MENKKQIKQLGIRGLFPRLFLVILFSAVASFAFAQNKTITGSVVDAKGESVIGASVLVKGTTNGTISDIDGNFTLKNVANNATLQVSYIGYISQSVIRES